MKAFNEKTINELVRASFEMGKVKTGALMVIERSTPPRRDRENRNRSGWHCHQPALINIFEHNTPLHDGAVVIRGNRVTVATCYLPLSDNMGISKDLGTRHRAAVGVSEASTVVTIVVPGGNRTGNGGVRRTASQGSQRRRTEEPSVHID